MEIVKEDLIIAKSSTVTENTACCLKCKGKENNTCSKILFHEKTQESENNKSNDLKNWQPDILADYIYREHHQYYYKEESVLAELLANCMNHLETKDYELERLEGFFRNLRNDLSTHYLAEETVLFPYIKDMVTAKANGSSMKPSAIKKIAKPIQVMEAEHKSAEAVLEEIEAVTNHYTPSSGASETVINLYKKLKALHENFEQHIYIENNILFPKVIYLNEELTNLKLL